MVTALLLPMFFVYSGLNTKMGLVDTPYLWAVAMAVLAAACFGKGVACWSAARLSGEPQRDAVAIGALMNARGLMELILLNIGLERGIITQGLFSIMVFMAIVTTLSATPMFELVLGKNGSAKRRAYLETNARRWPEGAAVHESAALANFCIRRRQRHDFDAPTLPHDIAHGSGPRGSAPTSCSERIMVSHIAWAIGRLSL